MRRTKIIIINLKYKKKQYYLAEIDTSIPLIFHKLSNHRL